MKKITGPKVDRDSQFLARRKGGEQSARVLTLQRQDGVRLFINQGSVKVPGMDIFFLIMPLIEDIEGHNKKKIAIPNNKLKNH